MAHCVRFQFKNNESFHSEIIEHEVNIEIVNVGSYMLLAFDKSESSAKFKNKLFQIINQCLFQLRLTITCISSETHKLGHCRVLDIFKRVFIIIRSDRLYLRERRILPLRCEPPLKILR